MEHLEPQCKVTLMHHTPLYIGAHGARTCWDSGDKSDTELRGMHISPGGAYECNLESHEIKCGQKDAELLDRVGNKFKHASILEHLSYNFFITDVSRALLQELARHRISSFSVKSTRYTLKELKAEKPFSFDNEIKSNYERAKKYLVLTNSDFTNESSIFALDRLRHAISIGVSNDIAKYCLPEAYKTSIQWTINARSLQNFLSLRSDKSALWEIRQLANAVYSALPEDHKYLFKDHVKVYENETSDS